MLPLEVTMELINSEKLPPAAGHYSHAVRAGGMVYVSGVLPSKEIEGFDAQVLDVLKRCTLALEAAGCELKQVAQCTAYIVGVENWPKLNALYAAHFGDHRPARAVVPVTELHYGALVEIQMTAVA